MSFHAEQSISSTLLDVLADVLVGAEVTQDPRLREVLRGLERFLPSVLSEVHHEWARESLDGILASEFRKTGEREAALFGLCILITDQALVPFQLEMAIDASRDQIVWLELRLGERDERGLMRPPYASEMNAYKRTIAIKDAINDVKWAYRVGFGERPCS